MKAGICCLCPGDWVIGAVSDKPPKREQHSELEPLRWNLHWSLDLWRRISRGDFRHFGKGFDILIRVTSPVTLVLSSHRLASTMVKRKKKLAYSRISYKGTDRLSLWGALHAGKLLVTNGVPIWTCWHEIWVKGAFSVWPSEPIWRVESDALDELQLKRYCCRRMVLTHVDLIEKLLHYNRTYSGSCCLLSSSEVFNSDGADEGQS